MTTVYLVRVLSELTYNYYTSSCHTMQSYMERENVVMLGEGHERYRVDIAQYELLASCLASQC